MPNTDDQARTCRGEKDNGEPCRCTIVGEDGYCVAHRPGNREELRRRARRGGKAKAKKDRHGGLNLVGLPALTDHESAKIWLEHIARELAAGRVSRHLADQMRKLLGQWMSAHQARMQDELLAEIQERLAVIEEQRGWGPGAGP